MDTPLPADPAPPPQATAPEPVIERAAFTGDGYEYFRIWIVNLALTIATLGIYSAWAKVRRLQYFYRNTHLAGASFDYHGDPIAIFKGRLIAGAMFLFYSFGGFIHPRLTIVAAAMIGAAIPWMISRSLRFRAHNSSYRGLRFRFDGSTQEAYWQFLALPVLTLLSFFTLGPFWHHRLKQYQFTHTSYGQMRFGFAAPVGDFYVTYIAAVFIGFAALMGVVALVAGGMTAAGVAGGLTGGDERPLLIVTAMLTAIAGVLYLAGVLGVQAFTAARIRNIVWNNVTVGQRRFHSHVHVWKLLLLTLTNLAGTIVTLGLFWPFAQVRLARYMTATLSTEGPESFDEFLASAAPEEEAVGEELTEMFDFDIAF